MAEKQRYQRTKIEGQKFPLINQEIEEEESMKFEPSYFIPPIPQSLILNQLLGFSSHFAGFWKYEA